MASDDWPNAEFGEIGASVAVDLSGLEQLNLPAARNEGIHAGRVAYESLLVAAHTRVERAATHSAAVSSYEIESDRVEEVLAATTEQLAAALTEARAESKRDIATADLRRAVEMIDGIRGQLDIALLGGGSPPFTASFGVSDTTLWCEPEQLIRMADDALYKAKDAGRNCALVAQDSSASTRMEWRQPDHGDGIDQGMVASS